MEDILKILSSIKWPGIVVVIVFLTIKYVDKIQVWISILERGLGKVSSRYRRKAI